MKKVNVDNSACIGCGACVAIDPTHFDFNDDGLSSVISNDNLDGEDLTNAIESCPTGAISLSGCGNENCECEDCHCGDDCHCENGECDCK